MWWKQKKSEENQSEAQPKQEVVVVKHPLPFQWYNREKDWFYKDDDRKAFAEDVVKKALEIPSSEWHEPIGYGGKPTEHGYYHTGRNWRYGEVRGVAQTKTTSGRILEVYRCYNKSGYDSDNYPTIFEDIFLFFYEPRCGAVPFIISEERKKESFSGYSGVQALYQYAIPNAQAARGKRWHQEQEKQRAEAERQKEEERKRRENTIKDW